MSGRGCCDLASFLKNLIITKIPEIHQKPDFDNGKIGAKTQ